MLHSCYLIDMNRWKSERIKFWPRVSSYASKLPNWPLDDNIYVSGMFRLAQIDTWVDNTLQAGWFPYPVQSGILQNEVLSENKFIFLKMLLDWYVYPYTARNKHWSPCWLEYSTSCLLRRPRSIPASAKARATGCWWNFHDQFRVSTTLLGFS